MLKCHSGHRAMIIAHSSPSSVINSDSVPVIRRTKGQRAMQAALEIEINNLTTREAATKAGVSQASMAQACVVKKCAPDLVAGILDNSMALEAGYLLCRSRKAIEEEARNKPPTPAQVRERMWASWAKFRQG
jgi:hypothetical protein